ncbi:hypothetical protein HETIRDRAFT_479197 [Heterobasidion irregulare TC 32-1]|uniref:Transmembrane protein n=1 Tax=Heterobasidion irregulare (strain TC 32-1) TaxID=747525 RepID=W4JWT6_HETIT|nr:uncharacterized protein HETIRDRAFT_479197 [Heterobasidion irregulare TC 32-1]ETW78022.1 hypothetical protein HETIRDRAFT_479197 [Heterobasidion irregulare TC 32-1]
MEGTGVGLGLGLGLSAFVPALFWCLRFLLALLCLPPSALFYFSLRFCPCTLLVCVCVVFRRFILFIYLVCCAMVRLSLFSIMLSSPPPLPSHPLKSSAAGRDTLLFSRP